MNIPSLLLIEENVKVKSQLAADNNVLFFDRAKPHIAIQHAKDRIASSKNQTTLVKKKDNTMAWVLGGLAALVILALLTQLVREKAKNNINWPEIHL